MCTIDGTPQLLQCPEFCAADTPIEGEVEDETKKA